MIYLQFAKCGEKARLGYFYFCTTSNFNGLSRGFVAQFQSGFSVQKHIFLKAAETCFATFENPYRVAKFVVFSWCLDFFQLLRFRNLNWGAKVHQAGKIPDLEPLD